MPPKKYPFKYLPGYDPYRDAGNEYYFNEKVALRYVKFIENELKFTKDKWKGKPFKLTGWQRDSLMCLFGWLRKTDDIRRYRTFFLYIPRKNGKSEFIAAIANAIFFIEKVHGAEIYIGARDRNQASTLYNMVLQMIMQNSDLDSEITALSTSKEIKAHWDSSKIQAISSDALSIHSLSPSVGIIDEVHAQPNGDLIEALETGQGAREQPLMILITTADIDRPSVCNEELEMAKAIRDGQINNPRYFPMIFETPKDSNWRSEETWKKANPTYPITPSKDFMEASATKAEKSLRKLANFKRYNLNMITSNVEGWLNMDDWAECKQNYEPEDLKGKECFGAVDLSMSRDMSSFCLLFDEGYESLCWFYTTEEAVRRDKSNHYQEWVDEGLLKIAGETSIDYEYIRADIKAAAEMFTILQIGYDPYNATQFAKQLEVTDGFEMIKFSQGYGSINEPAKEFENLISEHTFQNNNKILTWQAGNVCIIEDHNANIKPVKTNRDSPLKIDGIVCLVMCTGLKILKDLDEMSTYNDNDLLVI
jgi:phage terminase large subunit-like protein